MTTVLLDGVRIADMPDLGAVTDSSSFVGEHAGSGRFLAPAVRVYSRAPYGELWLTDFGADPTGVAFSDAAFAAFVSAVLTTGRPGFVDPAHFIFASSATIDFALTEASRTGARFYGVQGRSVLDFSAVSSFPALLLTSENVSHSCFYGAFTDISIIANCAGPAVAIGTLDHAAAFNGFDFKVQISNSDNSPEAIGLQVNGAFNSKIWVTANNGGHGDAIQCTYMAFCAMFGAGGHCDVAQHLTDFFVFANTFEALDLEVTNTCVVIDGASCSRNTWIGGQFVFNNGSGSPVAAINATAGNNNRFIGCNFGAGTLALNSTGIIVYGAGVGTEEFGGVTITPTGSADAYLQIGAIAGQGTHILLQVNGLNRWELTGNNADETGGNVGSDFVVTRLDDSGAAIDNPLFMTRSTGVTNITHAALGVGAGGTLSFYSASPATKKTVTGVKAGNTDLTLSILATLVSLGLFTDGST